MVIVIKSCHSTHETKTSVPLKGGAVMLKDLTPDDLKALGIEGDTPQDTLRTIVGNFRHVQERLDTIDNENKTLREANKGLMAKSNNITDEITQAVTSAREAGEQQQSRLRADVTSLNTQVSTLLARLKRESTVDGAPAPGAEGQDIPPGLGYDRGHVSLTAEPPVDGMQWVEPHDGIALDASGHPVGGSNTNPATGFTFASSFPESPSATLSVNSSTPLAASTPAPDESVDPVYTLPENATLVGSKAMTALLGRVPVDGKVTDPYPFKVIIGKDNLTANGIELPDVQGAIVSGTATGDWTLSCVRGALTSMTFVFTDGTVRTIPAPEKQNAEGRQEGQSNNGGNTGINGNTGNSIGWISDDSGIPCISGTRKSNASTYLPTIGLLAAASAGGDAVAQNQNTSQTNAYGGVTSTLTGDAGQAVVGKALSGGLHEVVDWAKARYGQTFDAIYVPPGQSLALHITRQLDIDYAEKGRKVKYDFSLAAHGTGLD
jgi:integrating conjugative element protein (TIGR03752 family)